MEVYTKSSKPTPRLNIEQIQNPELREKYTKSSNSTWTLTKTLKTGIDSFQRRIICTYVLNIKWPKIVTNEQVYEQTNITPWSTAIDKCRLRWFGHVARMRSDTPAK